MSELLRDVPVETQNQIYEGMVGMKEEEWEAFQREIEHAVTRSPMRAGGRPGGAGGPSSMSAERETREARTPKVGDLAPDFDVTVLDGEGRVNLPDLRGQPVGLIFGSYT